jgi:hypothetical protein
MLKVEGRVHVRPATRPGEHLGAGRHSDSSGEVLTDLPVRWPGRWGSCRPALEPGREVSLGSLCYEF